MVKIASATLTIAALSVVATYAAPLEITENVNVVRDIEDIDARDPSFGSFIKGAGKVLGGVVKTILRREEELELAAREPGFPQEHGDRIPGGFKGIIPEHGVNRFPVRPKIGTPKIDAAIKREIDDLIARDPSFGSFLKGAGKALGGIVKTVLREVDEDLAAREPTFADHTINHFPVRPKIGTPRFDSIKRELEEMEARDPSFGSFIKGAGKVLGGVVKTILRREEELELEARDPSFGSFIKGAGKVIGKVAGAILRREAELDARDPSFGSFIKGAGKVLGKVAGSILRELPEGLEARDVELIGEIAAREMMSSFDDLD